jgi:hypothetical protein
MVHKLLKQINSLPFVLINGHQCKACISIKSFKKAYEENKKN